MLLGTLFTLFVVPVFYSLIAADHAAERAAVRESELELGTEAQGSAALGMA
jgi:hypothetical protein